MAYFDLRSQKFLNIPFPLIPSHSLGKRPAKIPCYDRQRQRHGGAERNQQIEPCGPGKKKPCGTSQRRRVQKHEQISKTYSAEGASAPSLAPGVETLTLT